jgi:hypothetical protein
MHCGICGANDSIEQRVIDAEDSTTQMEFKMHVVFCVECGKFGVGIATHVAMLDFGKPRSESVAPTWELPREWLRPKEGKHPEATRRVAEGVD